VRDEPERDLPLDELRGIWRGLEPEPPPEDLAASDPHTRAAVEWMRAAWAGLPVPQPRVPLPGRPARPRHVLRLAAGLAAAAAALALLWPTGVEQSVQRSDDRARSEAGDTARRASVEAPARLGAEAPQLASLGPDHVELRSGPVRLILLKDRHPQ